MGSAESYKQQYFAVSKYGYDEARRAAHALNEQWRQEAREIIRSNKILQLHRNYGPHSICRGFRAKMSVSQNKKDKNVVYFTPAFSVAGSSYGIHEKVFLVSVHGYEGAFEQAAIWFCGIHRLDKWMQLALLDMIPDRSVFTGYLFDKLLLNGHGHRITRQMIREKLE